MEIWIYEYQPTWPAAFLAIQAELASDLALAHVPYLAIEHIGSTSVPGLAAKNIIDILIVIPAPAFTPATRARFQSALMLGEKQGGYYCLGDGGVRGRWSFKLRPMDDVDNGDGGGGGGGGARRVERHVYVVAEGSVPWRSVRALRDTLRVDEGLRDEYARVKVEASGGSYANVMQYSTKKNDVVRKILRRAGWSEEEVDEKEAQAVKDWPVRVEI